MALPLHPLERGPQLLEGQHFVDDRPHFVERNGAAHIFKALTAADGNALHSADMAFVCEQILKR
jgi:hypothetical protein